MWGISIYMCVCIHIHTHTHHSIYVYIDVGDNLGSTDYPKPVLTPVLIYDALIGPSVSPESFLELIMGYVGEGLVLHALTWLRG